MYNKPLRADDGFGEVGGKLFGERHALAPDIVNSPKWMGYLRNIQSDFRVTPVQVPLNGQPLALVFNTVAFAKQRFDSTAEPVAKMALMLAPIAPLTQHGHSAARVSNFKPHEGKAADEISFNKSMHTEQVNHAPEI